MHDKQYRSVPFGEELIKEMVMASVFSLPLSQNSAMTAYKLMIQRVTKVAQVGISCISGRKRVKSCWSILHFRVPQSLNNCYTIQAFEHFVDMSHDTQTALMKENADLVVR